MAALFQDLAAADTPVEEEQRTVGKALSSVQSAADVFNPTPYCNTVSDLGGSAELTVVYAFGVAAADNVKSAAAGYTGSSEPVRRLCTAPPTLTFEWRG
jgi:hypothetical protein